MRITRRNRNIDDLGLKSSGGITDLFDNEIKTIYRISDAEYDYLAEKMNDEELDLFVTEKRTFAQKRKLIQMLEKYLIQFANEQKLQ